MLTSLENVERDIFGMLIGLVILLMICIIGVWHSDRGDKKAKRQDDYEACKEVNERG